MFLTGPFFIFMVFTCFLQALFFHLHGFYMFLKGPTFSFTWFLHVSYSPPFSFTWFLHVSYWPPFFVYMVFTCFLQPPFFHLHGFYQSRAQSSPAPRSAVGSPGRTLGTRNFYRRNRAVPVLVRMLGFDKTEVITKVSFHHVRASSFFLLA